MMSTLRASANRWCLTGSADAVAVRFLDPGHIPAVPCGSLVAVFIFFLANESWLKLHREPRLLQGYNVAEFYWKATHLRGTI